MYIDIGVTIPFKKNARLVITKKTCLGTQCPTLSEERVLMLMSRSNTLQDCFDNLSSLGGPAV